MQGVFNFHNSFNAEENESQVENANEQDVCSVENNYANLYCSDLDFLLRENKTREIC